MRRREFLGGCSVLAAAGALCSKAAPAFDVAGFDRDRVIQNYFIRQAVLWVEKVD